MSQIGGHGPVGCRIFGGMAGHGPPDGAAWSEPPDGAAWSEPPDGAAPPRAALTPA